MGTTHTSISNFASLWSLEKFPKNYRARVCVVLRWQQCRLSTHGIDSSVTAMPLPNQIPSPGACLQSGVHGGLLRVPGACCTPSSSRPSCGLMEGRKQLLSGSAVSSPSARSLPVSPVGLMQVEMSNGVSRDSTKRS